LDGSQTLSGVEATCLAAFCLRAGQI